MNHKKWLVRAVALALVLFSVIGCNATEAESTPVPPTATPQPTSTHQPTATPGPPTATPTPEHAYFSKEEVLEIPSISSTVGEGEVRSTAGSEPETMRIEVNGSVPVVNGKMCLCCVDTIYIGPNLNVSTTWFTEDLESQGVSATFSNLAIEGPVPEDATEFIVSGPEGATLKKVGRGFLLEEGEAYLLTDASQVASVADSAVPADATNVPVTPSATPIPPTETPTPMAITIRVRMDNNELNGEINIEVLEGSYQLTYGTTLRAGSKIWEEEQFLTFPAGLAIEVGPAGLTLGDNDYPQGTLLFVEEEGRPTVAGTVDSVADQPAPTPVVDEPECQDDDGTQSEFYALESPFISHEVLVDGEISTAEEWSHSLCVNLRFHEGIDYLSNNVQHARWWVQNDGQFVYYLARVSGALSVSGVVADYFWPRYTGTWAHSDGAYVNTEGEYQDLANWDETQFYEDIELTPPGSIDVEAAANTDGYFYWFEIKKPLDSGDQYDWAVEPGQVIGHNPSDSLLFALIFEDGFFARNIQMRLGEP